MHTAGSRPLLCVLAVAVLALCPRAPLASTWAPAPLLRTALWPGLLLSQEGQRFHQKASWISRAEQNRGPPDLWAWGWGWGEGSSPPLVSPRGLVLSWPEVCILCFLSLKAAFGRWWSSSLRAFQGLSGLELLGQDTQELGVLKDGWAAGKGGRLRQSWFWPSRPGLRASTPPQTLLTSRTREPHREVEGIPLGQVEFLGDPQPLPPMFTCAAQRLNWGVTPVSHEGAGKPH